MRHPLFEFLQALPPYGWLFRVLLLPTPPRGAAVTVGYRPEWACLGKTCTFPDQLRSQAHDPGLCREENESRTGVALMNELGH